jgi:hypothetical protein
MERDYFLSVLPEIVLPRSHGRQSTYRSGATVDLFSVTSHSNLLHLTGITKDLSSLLQRILGLHYQVSVLVCIELCWGDASNLLVVD